MIDKIVVFIVIHNSDTIVLGDKNWDSTAINGSDSQQSYSNLIKIAIFNSMGSVWKFVTMTAFTHVIVM